MTTKSAIDQRAIEILQSNDRGAYTVPTHGLYPFQWNWDSVFVALGFAQFDRNRAWTELETLVSAQWPDGMIPHIVFHKDDPGYFPGPEVWRSGTNPPTSGICNQPVLATAIRQLWEADGADPSHPRMVPLYRAALASHRWFAKYRDPLGNGLTLVTHNWETGRDNNSEWDDALERIDTSRVGSYQRRDTSHIDASMRPTNAEYDRYVAIVQFGRECGWDHAHIAANGPFKMVDVSMSMTMLRANRDLCALAQALGDTSVVDELTALIAKAEQGMDWLWNDEVGAYCSRDLVTGASTGLVTSGSFLGLMSGVSSPARRERLLQTLQRVSSSAEFLVPSLEAGSRRYDHLRYWRGPVWLVVNYLVALGLNETDEQQWAERIRNDSARLIERSGFYESFSPETGEGTGGKDFAWTAAMWLAWCGKDR